MEVLSIKLLRNITIKTKTKLLFNKSDKRLSKDTKKAVQKLKTLIFTGISKALKVAFMHTYKYSDVLSASRVNFNWIVATTECHCYSLKVCWIIGFYGKNIDHSYAIQFCIR